MIIKQRNRKHNNKVDDETVKLVHKFTHHTKEVNERIAKNGRLHNSIKCKEEIKKNKNHIQTNLNVYMWILAKYKKLEESVEQFLWKTEGKNNGSINQVFRENLKNSPIKTIVQGKGKKKRDRPRKTCIKRRNINFGYLYSPLATYF